MWHPIEGRYPTPPASHSRSSRRSSPVLSTVLRLGLLALPVLAPSGAAVAQSESEIRSRFYLPMPPEVEAAPAPWTRPAASALSPSGYGAEWGDVYGGMGYQARARYSDGDDAVAAGGFGLGDGGRWIGVDVTVLSFTTFRRGFFTRWGVDLKLHRRLAEGLSVAAGWEGIHEQDSDSGESRYLAATKFWGLRDSRSEAFSDLILTVGAGDGRFLSEPQFIRDEGGINVFASASVRVLEPISLIVDWTGQDLATGVSVAPLRAVPLVVTTAFVDLTGAAGDGARFTGSTGLSLRTCSLLPC